MTASCGVLSGGMKTKQRRESIRTSGSALDNCKRTESILSLNASACTTDVTTHWGVCNLQMKPRQNRSSRN